jgi:PhnB protein
MAIHELYTYLRVRRAAEAIAFYQHVFGAKEKLRLTEPGGRVGHAELSIGGATLMLSDEYPELGFNGPETLGAVTSSIHLHVDDADALIQRAVEAGAVVVRPAADHFYGERSGTVRDPFGHEWMIGHNIEQVAPEEMQRRYDRLFEGGEVC